MTNNTVSSFSLMEEALPPSVPAVVARETASSFPGYCQILIAGSHAKGCANAGSDIDVFVFLPKIQEVRREVTRVQGHLVDLAVHDFSSIRAVLTREQGMSVCALADDLLHSIPLVPPSAEDHALQAFCRTILAEGPKPFDLDSLRSHLLGQTADLRHSVVASERQVIALSLAFKVAIFEVRARGGWIGSGRHLARDLERLSPGFVESLSAALVGSLAGRGDDPLIHQVEAVIRTHFGEVDRQWRFSSPFQ